MTPAAHTAPLDIPMIRDAAAFEQWLQTAAVGALVVYAQGRELPRAAACTVLAREWERAKLISLRAYRDGDGAWRWVARKADVAPGMVKAGAAARAQNRFDESPQQSVLRLIKRCVNFGLPCPTLAQIADVAGYASDGAGRQAARRILHKLESDGDIRVQNMNNGRRRIVMERGAKAGRATGWRDLTGQNGGQA